MKLSKTFALILILIAFAVIITGLYSFYSRRVSQRDVLLNSQKTNQKIISRIDGEKRTLESQLAQSEASLKDAKLRLEEVKKSFPVSVESIEYGEEIARLADEAKLKFGSLAAKPTTEETIDGTTYLVSRIAIEVKGELSNILSFVDSVSMGTSFRSTSMQTLEIADMDKPESVARLSITIYGLKGN